MSDGCFSSLTGIDFNSTGNGRFKSVPRDRDADTQFFRCSMNSESWQSLGPEASRSNQAAYLSMVFGRVCRMLKGALYVALQ